MEIGFYPSWAKDFPQESRIITASHVADTEYIVDWHTKPHSSLSAGHCPTN